MPNKPNTGQSGWGASNYIGDPPGPNASLAMHYARGRRGFQREMRNTIAPRTTKEAFQRWVVQKEPWRFLARKDQMEPPGKWAIWLYQAGRGAGKTRAGCEWAWKRALSHPNHIVHLISPTHDDLKKVTFDGPSGLLRLVEKHPGKVKSFTRGPWQINFTNGSKIIGFSAETPDRLRGPQCHSCLVAGTMVETIAGPRLIETIRTGDVVWTREGWKPVHRTESKPATVGTVEFANGASLTGTFDHPVLTDEGWKRLSELAQGESVCAINASSSRDASTTTTEPTTTTEASNSGAATGEPIISTEKYGSQSTGQYRTAGTFTTETETKQTTDRKTSSASALRSTKGTTQRQVGKGQSSPSRKSDAQSVKGSLSDPSEKGKAQTGNAGPATTESGSRKTRPSGHASSAGSSSSASREIFALSVASTWQPEEVSDVFNIEVEGCHEYVANGIIVHNCLFDEAAGAFRNASDVFTQAMFGLRLLGPQGQEPRMMITSTPVPIPLFKRLNERVANGDPRVVITRATMSDNIGNLSEAAVDELKSLYEGTRLGRQELDGELLLDVPGALWNPDMVQQVSMPARFDRIVVSVDPSGAADEKSNSDEIGIAVCGLVKGRTKHDDKFYMLEDATLLGSPLQWGQRAVTAFEQWDADRIVAEVNFGGAMCVSTINQVDPSVPVKKITASRGKIIRAEPVAALYESGRVFHVGRFQKMEDQMFSFTNTGYVGDDSPDRVDAMVHAINELSGRGHAPRAAVGGGERESHWRGGA